MITNADAHRTRVDHVIDAWHRATPAQRRTGAAWYPLAYELAAKMDPDNPSRAAGVIAALSPQQRWNVNVANAATVIGWADAGADMAIAPRLHFTTQMAKAIAIAAHNVDPLDVLRGPKERAFYGAIMGHADAVVIDRWAARVAEPETRHGTKDERVSATDYRRIAEAYRNAARYLRRPVRDVQATTWVVTRGSAD
jgi:hypothetical protein